jgi:CBS domain-containing protein
MISARLAVVDLNATVRAAALSLSTRGIGLAVICDQEERAAGVLSKSDLVRHLTQPRTSEAPIATLMSRPFVSCTPSDDVHSVWQIMSRRELQNMPVLNPDGRPVGVLDIRDALKVLFEQEEIQERMLIDYIAGTGYR